MTEQWDNAAKAVNRERRARRMSIRDACAVAGISTTTWINAEKGMRVSELTQSAIARAFGWPADAFDRLLDGADPASFHDGDKPESLDELASSLSDEDRERVIAIIETFRQKR